MMRRRPGADGPLTRRREDYAIRRMSRGREYGAPCGTLPREADDRAERAGRGHVGLAEQRRHIENAPAVDDGIERPPPARRGDSGPGAVGNKSITPGPKHINMTAILVMPAGISATAANDSV